MNDPTTAAQNHVIDDHEEGSSINRVMDQAVTRLLNDEPLPAFCDWFARHMGHAVHEQHSLPAGSEAELLRHQRCVARTLWAHMPVPSNRWRARGVPKIERNSPCHCGSGKKFTQCCAEFGTSEMPLDADALFTLALNRATPDMLSAAQVRQIPAHVLGGIAMEWNDQGRPDKTVALLQPLFQQPQGLNERHDPALDALLDAMLQLGKEHERRDFLHRMVDHPNKPLATTARCRLVTMLADQGDYPAAWTLFQDTTRFHSNDPQLWQLELTLLLSQGRDDEAKLRAPLLAAQARKVGMDELAHMLLKLAQEGTGAI